CHEFGSSFTKDSGGRNPVPSGPTKLNANTLNPLTLPSVPSNRKLTMLVPAVIVPAGRFSVILSVGRPPPIPPYTPAFPSSVAVLSLIGIQALLFTLTLACA